MELEYFLENLISSKINVRLLSNYFRRLVFAIKFMMTSGLVIAWMFIGWVIVISMSLCLL